MAAKKKKREEEQEEGAPAWLLSWGDLTTLLLTFFVMMFDTGKIDVIELRMALAPLTGMGSYMGGNTLAAGKLAELGNNLMSLPSSEMGQSLSKARRQAESSFQPELKSRKVRVKQDERGLTISLAADSFFREGTAEVDIEEARDTLRKIGRFLASDAVAGRKFRIEGHTDNTPTDPQGPYRTNWELSLARGANVLHYLVDFGAPEPSFQVAGFADTVPLIANDTPEGRAYNRRVDIIILSPGHL
jgi:chemotaxis protein MotB